MEALSRKERENAGQENDESGCSGGEGEDEDRGGGEVFGFADEGVVIGRDAIGEVFEGGIEEFGGEDEGDGEGESDPFGGGDAEEEAEREGGGGGEAVDTEVELGAESDGESAEGVAEAVEEFHRRLFYPPFDIAQGRLLDTSFSE